MRRIRVLCRRVGARTAKNYDRASGWTGSTSRRRLLWRLSCATRLIVFLVRISPIWRALWLCVCGSLRRWCTSSLRRTNRIQGKLQLRNQLGFAPWTAATVPSKLITGSSSSVSSRIIRWLFDFILERAFFVIAHSTKENFELLRHTDFFISHCGIASFILLYIAQ